MFGTKIRSWMEAHIARSRAKKKERAKGAAPAPAASLLEQEARAAAVAAASRFDPKLFGARADFNEILPSLPISPSSFKPRAQEARRGPQQPHQQHAPQPEQRYGTSGVVVVGSAVNLSSPESAYSTGYSTDGTSPCATYAPEYYINVRPVGKPGLAQHHQLQRHAHQQHQHQQHQHPQFDGGTQTRARGRRESDRIEGGRCARSRDRSDETAENTGTYTVSAQRSRFLEGKEYEHHPWRKPAPPTTSRPAAASPKIQAGHLMRKPYSTPVVTDCGSGSSYPLQLFSPRRMPLVATTTTQVMPVKSPRQRSRVRTNPWPSGRAAPGIGRPWSRQQQYAADYCCRQESLSVGRSPVNRSEWRGPPQQQHQIAGRRSRARSGSSRSSSCSSRSRSCSLSSANGSSCSSQSSSDDVTLNEVMGKFDENYLYDKETDIVSDHSGSGLADNISSSANFSSDASASSLELHLEGSLSGGGGGSGSRPASRHQLQQRALSGRRQRRRRHRRSSSSRDEEEREHLEEVELLQEVLNRRLKKNNSEASAQTNRALLERLLMKNASSGFEGRRAWSANPAIARSAASRSVGGTPICLRRKTPRANHVLSPPSRLIFERNHQVYPAESTSSLKNMSASELALIEADKEADLKYAQLIMEAERMLVNAQQQLQREESASNSRRSSAASVTADGSPSRFPRRVQQQQQQFQQICTGSAPNKRVELIKNAELNIELALSKSRNSQPELSSGSIKDLLDHSSPKRLLQQQQKKVIDPIFSQAVASTQTSENNFPAFESLDVNPAAMTKSVGQGVELSSTSEHYACPQSEPVKRKVYEEGGRLLLQRQAAPWLGCSDGDCAMDPHQSQLQSASAASSYSQLRKQMLIETLQGLKQSLEDQSMALKMNCLRPL